MLWNKLEKLMSLPCILALPKNQTLETMVETLEPKYFRQNSSEDSVNLICKLNVNRHSYNLSCKRHWKMKSKCGEASLGLNGWLSQSWTPSIFICLLLYVDKEIVSKVLKWKMKVGIIQGKTLVLIYALHFRISTLRHRLPFQVILVLYFLLLCLLLIMTCYVVFRMRLKSGKPFDPLVLLRYLARIESHPCFISLTGRLDFFILSYHLKSLNHTNIVLIPKKDKSYLGLPTLDRLVFAVSSTKLSPKF